MRIPPHVLATPLYWLYRGWCATLRFEEVNRQSLDSLDSAGKSVVACLWHDELFALMYMKRQLDIVTVVSASRDGQWLAVLLEKLGLRTVRGSSSRGGVKALIGAAHLMRKEHVHGCITVDGPRGPRHQAKEGALLLAHHVGAYVAPIRLIMQSSFSFKSWDRFQVPMPFSKVRVVYGKPWLMEDCFPELKASQYLNQEASQSLDKEILSEARQKLEAELNALAQELKKIQEFPPSGQNQESFDARQGR